MDNEEIVDAIIRREGGYVNDPLDKGGRTDKGISERAHPAAWKDGVITQEEARAIYLNKYVSGPGFDKIPDPRLRHQLVDYGVLSGPSIAIKALQRVLKVEEDGVLGPQTLGALPTDVREVNNLLMRERVKMIARIVERNPKQVRFLEGWINRVMEFLW